MAKSNTSGYDIEKDPFAPNKIFENGGKPLPEGENGQMILNENGEWVAIDPPFVKEEDIEGLETLINEIKEKTDELETSILQIETDVTEVKGQITNINTDITQLRSWVNDIDDIVQTIQQVDIAILYEEIETINASTIPGLRTEFNQSISTLTTNLNSVIEDITEINTEITNIKTVDIENLNTKYDGLATRLVTVEEELATLINETIPAIEHTIQIITETGTVGQVLTKTEDGIAWADSQGGGGGLPEGGTEGQVLTKTETGAEWKDPSKGINIIKSTLLNSMSDEEIRNSGVIYLPDKRLILNGNTADLDLIYSYEDNVQTFHPGDIFSTGINILIDDVLSNLRCDFAYIVEGRSPQYGDAYHLVVFRNTTNVTFYIGPRDNIKLPQYDGECEVYVSTTISGMRDMIYGYTPLVKLEPVSGSPYSGNTYNGIKSSIISYIHLFTFDAQVPNYGNVTKRQIINEQTVLYDPDVRIAEGFEIVNPDSMTIEENAMRSNKSAYIKNTYTNITNDTNLTVYLVARQYAVESAIETFLSNPYHSNQGNAPCMFYKEGKIYTSIYGNDYNTGYNSINYTVLAMRFIPGKIVEFYINGNLVKTETFNNIRDTVYFGISGLSGITQPDILMKFGALVKESEPSEIVIANQKRLMQRYGVV